jgi:hypothetical protein
MTPRTRLLINRALGHARGKHPRPARGRLHYTAVLLEEVAEHLWAVWRGRAKDAEREGCHVIAVIVRRMEGA